MSHESDTGADGCVPRADAMSCRVVDGRYINEQVTVIKRNGNTRLVEFADGTRRWIRTKLLESI